MLYMTGVPRSKTLLTWVLTRLMDFQDILRQVADIKQTLRNIIVHQINLSKTKMG